MMLWMFSGSFIISRPSTNSCTNSGVASAILLPIVGLPIMRSQLSIALLLLFIQTSAASSSPFIERYSLAAFSSVKR